MQTSDSGRKINQAMVSTGRAVATTSKAVGGAISQAKGVFSNWWTNLLVSPEPIQKALEALPDCDIEETTAEATIEENIPNEIISKNLSNGNLETIDIEDALPDIIHQPGEVHTV